MHSQHELEHSQHKKAKALFGGSQGLLRSAAAAVVDAGTYYRSRYPGDPTKQEICALADFGREQALMLDADVVEWVQHLISPDSPDSLRQGLEHRVGTWREKSRVIKVYDPREIDDLTFETFFKPAPLLFDYLTDHLLTNHFFGDEIRLEGFFEV